MFKKVVLAVVRELIRVLLVNTKPKTVYILKCCYVREFWGEKKRKDNSFLPFIWKCKTEENFLFCPLCLRVGQKRDKG